MRDEYILPSPMKYFPMNIRQGEMQFVYDDKGNKYLDGSPRRHNQRRPFAIPRSPIRPRQMKNLQHMTTLYYHPNLVRYARKNGDDHARRVEGQLLHQQRLRGE